MLLTEAEARKKVCWKTLHSVDGTAQPYGSWCPASLCMAWRWKPQRVRLEADIERGDHPERGFCGLAGKP